MLAQPIGATDSNKIMLAQPIGATDSNKIMLAQPIGATDSNIEQLWRNVLMHLYDETQDTFLTLFYINSLSVFFLLFFLLLSSSFVLFSLLTADEHSVSKALVFHCFWCFVL